MEKSKEVITKVIEFTRKVKHKQLALPCLFDPIVSFKSLLLAFVLLKITGLISIHLLNILLGKPSYSPQPLEALTTLMIITALSGVVEEFFFRGVFKLYLGEIGLATGTFIWIVLHQFKFATPAASPTMLVGDTLFGIFYFKLWRGRWWWVAPIIHMLWNPAVIILGNTYGIG